MWDLILLLSVPVMARLQGQNELNDPQNKPDCWAPPRLLEGKATPDRDSTKPLWGCVPPQHSTREEEEEY